MTISDELLLAYIDGELSREDRARVEAALAEDSEVAERLRRHRAVGAMIHEAFADAAEEPPPEHLVQMVRPAAAVVSLEAARAKRAEPKPKPKPARPAFPKLDTRWAGFAAALVVGVGIGVFTPRLETGLVDDRLRASGALNAALQSRLAATQPADAPIRIGLTFRDRSNRWCRSFTAPELSGVACRAQGRWQVRMAETGAPAKGGDYRTAASQASPAVMASVEGMIAGRPVDAAAEKAAEASGWR